MNYRQWKKKYKKEHGYNPPLKDDKRKQYKAIRKCIKGIKKINMQKLIKQTTENINKVFVDASKLISKGFADIAEQLRRQYTWQQLTDNERGYNFEKEKKKAE